eukprot:12910796-Prorocentrum_lima.AAC.1
MGPSIPQPCTYVGAHVHILARFRLEGEMCGDRSFNASFLAPAAKADTRKDFVSMAHYPGDAFDHRLAPPLPPRMA